MADHKRVAFFLPNTFTALNMACGFVAIVFAMKGEYYKASMLILLGAVFDSVDGRVARMTGTQSVFGEQFDSISDVITFGIAPALIFYIKFLAPFGRIGTVAAFSFLLCAALRLARFNANIDKISANYFQGMPSPGAALAIVGYVLISLEFKYEWLINEYVFVSYIIFYALLMVSNIPFPSFKSSPWLKEKKKIALFSIFVIFASLFIYEEVMVGIIISTYVILSIIYYLVNYKHFVGIFNWKEELHSNE